MATLGTFSVMLTGSQGKLTKAVKKAQRSLRSLRKQVDQLSKTIARYGAAVTAATAAIGGAFVIAQSKAIEEANLMAKRLGITTEAMTGLQYAASQFGLESEEMADAMKDLSEKIADAALNGGSYDETIRRMGLSSKALLKLPVDQQFFKVADAIGQMNTQGEKAFASMELMSDVGFKLVSAMDAGSGSIRKMMKEARSLGLVVNDEMAAGVTEANRMIAKSMAAITGIFRQATVHIAPYITVISDMFVKWITAGDGVSGMVNRVFKSIGTFVKNALFTVQQFAFRVQRMFVAIESTILNMMANFADFRGNKGMAESLRSEWAASQLVLQDIQRKSEAFRLLPTRDKIKAQIAELRAVIERDAKVIEQATSIGASLSPAALAMQSAQAEQLAVMERRLRSINAQISKAGIATATWADSLTKVVDGVKQKRVANNMFKGLVDGLSGAIKDGQGKLINAWGEGMGASYAAVTHSYLKKATDFARSELTKIAGELASKVTTTVSTVSVSGSFSAAGASRNDQARTTQMQQVNEQKRSNDLLEQIRELLKGGVPAG